MVSEVEKQIHKLKYLGADVKIVNGSVNDTLYVKMPYGCLDKSFQLGLKGRIGDKGESLLLATAIGEIEKSPGD